VNRFLIPLLNNDQDIEISLCGWLDKNIHHLSYNGLIICGDVNRVNLDIMQGEFNVTNIITENTRDNAVLDKFFINDALSSFYTEATITDPLASSDHKTILIFNNTSEHTKSVDHTVNIVYDFRLSYTIQINEMLCDLSHLQLPINDSIDLFTNTIYDNIYECLSCLPMKLVRRTTNDKPWMTDKIKSLINDRWKAYRRNNLPKYNHLKEKTKIEIKRAKQNWLSNTRKGSDLWTVVKFAEGKNTKTNTYDPDKLHDITTAAIKIYTSGPSPINNSLPAKSHLKINSTDIFEYCLHALTSIKTKKAIGLDQVPNKFYKSFLPYIIDPFIRLTQAVLSRCEFPNTLKHAYIIPIPKKKSSDTQNFRPISILNTLARCLEKAIFCFYENSFYSCYGVNQFGFRRGSSTTIALIYILEKVNDIMKQENSTGCLIIAVDLSKAFDRVNHSILVNKLINKDKLSLAALINSYLLHRTACIKIGKKQGDRFPVNRGVPQGSSLGPALFCTYMNDLMPKNPSTTLVKYADDITLIIPINAQIHENIETELANINDWCHRNEMIINTAKTQALPILKRNKTFSTRKIRCFDSIKILGFSIDKHLSFTTHFQKSVSRASQNIHVLKVLRNCVSQSDLFTIFTAKIKAVVEYGIEAIPNISSSSLYLIQRLYKRCFYFINNNISSNSDITHSKEKRALKLFKSILTDKTHSLHLFLPLRSHTGRFILPVITNERSHRSFFVFCALLFNKSFNR